MIVDEGIYEELVDRYEDYFTGGMGAEAIQNLHPGTSTSSRPSSCRDNIRFGKGQRSSAPSSA